MTLSTTGPISFGCFVTSFSQAAPPYPSSGALPVCGRDEHATEPSDLRMSTWPSLSPPVEPKVNLQLGSVAAASMFGVCARLAVVACSVAAPSARSFAAACAANVALAFAAFRESRSV